MKTVGVRFTIDSDLLSEVRKFASKNGITLGDLVSRQLRPVIRDRKGWGLARRRAIARLRRGYDLQWKRPASRSEMHEREVHRPSRLSWRASDSR